MMTYYSLRIRSSNKFYDDISSIMNVKPKDYKNGWSYEVSVGDDDNYFDFINHFLDLLEDKYKFLADIGVSREDIEIWMIYEYEDQCNMEFAPTALQRIGENGISLCISCYGHGSAEV